MTPYYELLCLLETAMHVADPTQDMTYIELAAVALDALLGDAEHIHVTRHPDDTITAVPMGQPVGELWCVFHALPRSRCRASYESCSYVPLWVDTPGGAA